VRFIGGTAQRIRDEDDAKAPVDCTQDCRKHADIGFAAGNNDRIDAGAAQLPVKIAPCPRRVDMLVKSPRGRNELRKIWHKPHHFGAELLDRH
jgi:hypothetical protein